MRLSSRSRIVLTIAAFLLLVIFIPPLVNVNRYRGRIATSISSALGRPVTVGNVSMRLFPQPGFNLEDLNVGEDPAFGIEPMLHADEVTANLRLSSLWRGRLEIASLSLKYPSLNLVRAADGRWNIEALLEHASRIPTAPTAKTRPEARPRFPYIEAENGRINFKIGQEKKVYALADSDFALWLASENEVRTRLAARLVRTDSYLSDTGTFHFNGRFQRAWDLRDTPLDVTMRLEKSQLGQLSKFIDGRDHGWRGAVDATVHLSGTPAALKIAAESSVHDFRRYDIGSTERVDLSARCSARYSDTGQVLSDISCRMPMNSGAISLHGLVSGVSHPHTWDLSIAAENVPVQSLVSIARHAKKHIPDDLSASGVLDADVTYRKIDENGPAIWAGDGQTSDLVFRSGDLKTDLALTPVKFSLANPSAAKHERNLHRRSALEPDLEGFGLVFAPVTLSLGEPSPATLAGYLNASGYSFTVRGPAQLSRLFQVARSAGLSVPETNADGTARLDLALAGKWAGFASVIPIGTAQLRSVSVRMKGIASPLDIASVTLTLTPDSTTAAGLAASFGDFHLKLAGSVSIPRPCDSLDNCPIEFDLHADQISTDELNRLFNPRAAKRPWYAILGRRPEPSFLTAVRATGHFSADHVRLKSIVATHASASVSLDGGTLRIANLSADLWGGRSSGQLQADFTGDSPSYTGQGTLQKVSVSQLDPVLPEDWGTGSLNGSYHFSASGWTAMDILSSAKGELDFSWHGGILHRVALAPASSSLRFRRFDGVLQLDNGVFGLSRKSKIVTASGIYEISGTASLDKKIDFVLRNSSRTYNVTGSLEKPKVALVPATAAQASLK